MFQTNHFCSLNNNLSTISVAFIVKCIYKYQDDILMCYERRESQREIWSTMWNWTYKCTLCSTFHPILFWAITTNYTPAYYPIIPPQIYWLLTVLKSLWTSMHAFVMLGFTSGIIVNSWQKKFRIPVSVMSIKIIEGLRP